MVQAKLNNRFSASACNRLYKLSFLRQRGLNFKSGIVYEDLLFNFQCMIQGARVYVLNELLYNYYIGRNDSIINTIKEKDLDDKIYKPASVQAIISNAKNALITPQAYQEN